MASSFLLASLFACDAPPPLAACPTFEETTVTDDADAPDVTEYVRTAFADFAGWTTREGVCVEEVVVTRSMTRWGVAGEYLGDAIHIHPETRSARRTTLHELCHAWDHVEGRPSEAHPDLFPPIPPTGDPWIDEVYPTDADRIREAFARVCEYGAMARAEAELYAALCDEPPTATQGEAWVQEHVFDAFVDTLDIDVALGPLSITRVHLWAEPFEGTRRTQHVAGDRLAVLDVDRWARTSLRLIDPETLEVTSLPLPADLNVSEIGLLSSNGDPVLWTTEPLRAWRLDPVTGAATALPLADRSGIRSLEGYVWDDTAWLLRRGGTVGEAPFVLDLRTGRTSALTGPTGREFDDDVRIVGNAGKVALITPSRVYTWSHASSTWSTVRPPFSPAASLLVPLADGGLAALYGVPRPVGSRYVPAVAETGARRWTFPDEPCDDIGLTEDDPLVAIGNALYAVVANEEEAASDLYRVLP